ncbi:hypothetical protein [Streptomyces sp. NPDC058476]|uniref:hypothetical protein n=1 Tax=Streptomyces sp. NPDC058476 TaxID=3346519 RepID=UPI00365770F1
MSNQAVRFRLEYEGRDVRLVSEQRIGMTLPPSDELGEGRHSGFWYELRDGDNQVLYRKVVYNPLRQDAEVFHPETGAPARVPMATESGTFWLTAPSHPSARYLVLYSSPPEPQRAAEAASELTRFELGR